MATHLFEKRLKYKNRLSKSSHNLDSLYRKRNSSFQGGTSAAIELLELRVNKEARELHFGSNHEVLVEINEGEKNLWKQKSSPKNLKMGVIVLGDYFKVKSVDGALDIKSTFLLRVTLMQEGTKIGSASIPLGDLKINKLEEKILSLENGPGDIALNVTLVNTEHPRNSDLTLKDITDKEGSPMSLTPPFKTTDDLSESLRRVNIFFGIHYHTEPGQELRVVGSNYKLGNWELEKAPRMNWNNGFWTLELSLRKSYIPFEYKYVVFDSRYNTARWETTANRSVPESSKDFLQLQDEWENLNK